MSLPCEETRGRTVRSGQLPPIIIIFSPPPTRATGTLARGPRSVSLTSLPPASRLPRHALRDRVPEAHLYTTTTTSSSNTLKVSLQNVLFSSSNPKGHERGSGPAHLLEGVPLGPQHTASPSGAASSRRRLFEEVPLFLPLAKVKACFLSPNGWFWCFVFQLS